MANDTTKKNSNPTGKKKKATVRNVVNGIIIVFLCCVLLGGVTGFFLLSQIIGKVSEDERKLEEKIINVEPSTLYSADGKVIYELGAESREIVEYEQIPQVTIDAFLAIEDYVILNITVLIFLALFPVRSTIYVPDPWHRVVLP